MIGTALLYTDLPFGASDADRLVSKRYYKDEVVQNFCLREFIFVASEVQRIE